MSLFRNQPSGRLKAVNLIDKGYYFGATDTDEVQLELPKSRRTFRLSGVPADAEYTFLVQPVRHVDQDVNSTGKLNGPSAVAKKRSLQPAQVPNITANIGGVAATTVSGGATKANAGLDSSGNVKRNIPSAIRIASGIMGHASGATFTGDTNATYGANAATNITNHTMDYITDGTTYGRPLASRLNAGKPVIDFSEAIHSNKNLANLDSTANTKLSGIAAGATVGADWTTNTSNRPTELTDGRVAAGLSATNGYIDFSRTHIGKTLDNVPDGTTYGALPLANITGTGTSKRALIDFTQAHTGKSLANVDSTANTKLSGIAAGATVGADWATNLSSRPTELTDGRVAAGLDASGFIDFSRGHANKSLANVDSTANTKLGGIATGATKNTVTYSATAPTTPTDGDIWVDTTSAPYQHKVRVSGAWQVASSNVTNTSHITDGANLGGTAVWTGVSSRPTELTDGRVAAGLNASGGIDFTNAAHTNKSLANVDSTANTKLTGIAAGATVGADWSSNLTSRPTELTDGRVSAGLNASGGIDFSSVNHTNKSLANVDSTANTKLSGIATGATKNTVTNGAAPSSPTAGDIWVDTTGTGLRTVYTHDGTTWVAGSTYGALSNFNIYDQSGVVLTDAKIKNSSMTINASGQITHDGTSTISTSVVANSKITLTAAGALSGAGGGSIAYDSLPDGTTYAKIKASQLTGTNIIDYDALTDGTTYGKIKKTYMTTGQPNLQIGSTGQQIGDVRNLPPVRGANLGFKYSGALSVGSLTTTTAAISVTAGSVTAGAATIAYNAQTASITGLSANTIYTYYFYYSDTGYAGGTKTLNFTTDPLTPYSNDAYVFMGSAQFQTPASGTSSGGSTYTGGGGCVEYKSWIETMERGWVRAKDIVPGDMIRVLNTDFDGVEWMPVLTNRILPENGYEITSESGITLRCSGSTPLTLKDGSSIYPEQLDGDQLPVLDNGKFRWERCTAEFKGAMPVCYISMGGLVYAAGVERERSILTHNLQATKP